MKMIIIIIDDDDDSDDYDISLLKKDLEQKVAYLIWLQKCINLSKLISEQFMQNTNFLLEFVDKLW